MADPASKATSLTTLKLLGIKVPIALFSTVAKPGRTPEGFTTAGPNGGMLMARQAARPVAENYGDQERYEDPGPSDPLAVDEPVAEVFGIPVSAEEIVDPQKFVDRLEQIEEAAAARVEGAPDRQTAAREALAAEAEGDARSRGLVDGPRGVHIGDLRGDVAEGGLVRFVTDDPRGMTGEPSGPMLDPSKCGPTHMFAGAERPIVSPPVAAEVEGEYGRELVEEGTGEVVRPDQVRRGVRLADGRFIDCTSQLAEIDERTRLEVAEILWFVDATKIPRTRVKASYFIGTDDPEAPVTLRIIHDGLRRTRRAAVVKLTKRSRQSLGAILPFRGALVLLELVFADDVRPAPARALRHMDVPPHEREVVEFCKLVDARSAPPYVLDDLRDDAIALREELHARALEGEVPDVLVPPEPENELLAQLEASLAAVAAG